jgi:precorrin-6Y C5,15-methyltransferase (decarboxylating)
MINVVGIGLDGAAGLSKKRLQIIANATVLGGSARHLSYFPNHGAIRIKLGDLMETVETIRHYFERQEKVVILVSGDPLFFGLGRFLLTQFSAEDLQFHPHISSVQLAFSSLKISWQDARVVTVHGRDFDELIALLKKGTEKIAVLTDSNHNPASILDLYNSLDIPVIYDFWVCENLGNEEEKITHYPEGKNLQNQSISPLNVVILIRKNQSINSSSDLEKLPLLGLPDRLFSSFADCPGLMTKREVRVMILGELALQPNQVVWDVGAGTGSVSIEIARLCPSSQVYAIEKTAIGISLIETNCQKLQVKNVICIHGKAPEILLDLPLANSIFIGGSAGNLSNILELCQQKLKDGGRIVMALATLENLQESINWFKQSQWDYHLLQAQISRSMPIANLTRFTPLNPVTIITAVKEARE